MKLMVGTLRPSAGTIEILGLDLRAVTDADWANVGEAESTLAAFARAADTPSILNRTSSHVQEAALAARRLLELCPTSVRR